MRFDELAVGTQVRCPLPDHGIHTVTALPRETYSAEFEVLRFNSESSHYAQFDDGSMISDKNNAIAEFTLVNEPPC